MPLLYFLKYGIILIILYCHNLGGVKMKRKKLFNLFMALILILSLVMAATVTASAATVKINKTKATVYVGSSITLKISNTSNKVSWSSSNKSIATVKSTGTKTAKVTAKAPGKATITAKVNGKKYKCVVTTKYKLGSRQNPAIAADGVTITTTNGKATYTAKSILVGKDAENLFKAISPEWWRFNNEYNSEDLEGNKLVALEYDVKVLSGYDDYGFTGYDIINPYEIYNEECNATLEGVKAWMFESTKDYTYRSDLELFEGGAATTYEFLLVPEDVTAFSTYKYDKNYKKYWVKYNLPQ